MPKIRKKFITSDIDESYYSIVNNIDNSYSHQKINDENNPSSTLIKSGVISSSKGKYLKASDSEPGTLPSVLQTTGKLRQDYNDPFNDTNILEYKQLLSNSNVGLPLINITEEVDGQTLNVGNYITTNTDLLSLGSISKQSDYYVSKYDLKNTNIFDEPNIFNNHMKHSQSAGNVYRKIKPDIDEIILKQKRFEEEYTPYTEDFSSFVIPEDGDEFYYETIDSDISKDYNLGKQREIKIVLDFSNSNTVDLTLLNTKMTFNLPQDVENYTSDDLISTKYINFIEGSAGAKSSYSSHFLPTAYWNFNKNRWNYLDGNLLSFDSAQEASLSMLDFPVTQSSDVKYSFLGAKNNTGFSTTISPNFIYSGNTLQSQEIYDKNLKNNVLSVYNKPIVTTPSFRPDGSLNKANTGENYNKTSISKITNSYGFPYKSNWQPANDHFLDMTKYISNDFLLEKISIKGSFTSRGEMPNKKGSFSSGYRQRNASLNSSASFNQTYDYKDNFEDYVSNNVTFFILNERKGFNHVKQKINAEPLQSYSFFKNMYQGSQSVNTGFDYYNTKGKKLESYLGSYSSYERYQNTLNVYSQIIPNSFIYDIDEYNDIVLKSQYTITSNSVEVSHDNSKNIFHFFEDVASPLGLDASRQLIDEIYIKDNINWNSDFDLDLVSDINNKKFNIKLEGLNNDLSSLEFNQNSGRELVTYANFLIAGKKENIDFDSKTLINIDGSKILEFNQSEEVNINIDQKNNFEIKSKVKSLYESDYTDESIYKIKSNFKEEVTTQEEELSSLSLSYADLKDVIVGAPLFQFDGTNSDSGEQLLHILSMPNSNTGPFSNLASYREATGISNEIGQNSSTCTYLNSMLKFSVIHPDVSITEKKECCLLIYFSVQNNIGVNSLKYHATNGFPSEINLNDFITYEVSDPDNNADDAYLVENVTGGAFVKVIFNLRFLDPFLTRGISEEFFDFGLEGNSDNYYVLNKDKILKTKDRNFQLSSDSSQVWSTAETSVKALNFIKFLYIGIYTSPLVEFTGQNAGQIITANNSSFATKYLNFTETPFVALNGKEANIKFFESKYDPFAQNTGNVINLLGPRSSTLGSYKRTGDAFLPAISMLSNNRGAPEVVSEEEYYNYNNVLEGKTKSNPSNLEVSSERVFVKQTNKNKNILTNSVKSVSGKELKSKDNLNIVENSCYLLKPEDRLVFGVSSNSNGEVMPTVVTLHDKLEITLIGRDFVSNSKHKTNESKSIRKIVTGDNDIERLGHSIYQTEGAYFDNVWNKTGKGDNLKVFDTKYIVGKNSSRDFGTYSGVTSFENFFNENNEIIYQADTVQPSLSNVYLNENCLNKKLIYCIDSRDRYEYDRKRRKNQNLPSYKMIFSDSIDKQNLADYPLRYTKVATDWHNTFHMQTYKNFFQDNRYKKVFDFSYDIVLNSKNDVNSNYFVYFDTNSYSAGLNYENDLSFEKKYVENGDKTTLISELGESSEIVEKSARYYNTLKTHLLPFSKHLAIQNPLSIKNDLDERSDKFIKNDKLIKKNLSKSSIFDIRRYTIQYMLHDIEPEYCDITEDVNYKLHGARKLEYSSSWCIVLEVSSAVFNSILSNLSPEDTTAFEKDVKTHTDTGTSGQYTITYYNKNMFLNISEKPLDYEDYEDINELKTVTKKFKLIKKDYDSSAIDDEYFLISPLYFWETGELNMIESDNTNIFSRETDETISSSIVGYGRKSNQYNVSNNTTTPNATWFALLRDNNNIGNTSHNLRIYEPFLILQQDESWTTPNLHPSANYTRKISISGVTDFSNFGTRTPIGNGGNLRSSIDGIKLLPYKYTELALVSNASNALIDRSILLSFANFSLKGNTSSQNAYENASENIQNLNNSFMLNKNKKYFISDKYFENKLSLVEQINKDSLTTVDEEDNSYNLNEKVYVSNCIRVVDDHLYSTNTSFVYKVKDIYIENRELSTQETFKTIEIKGLTNDFTIFRKNKVLEQELIYDFTNEDKIRVYEEKLRKNGHIYFEQKQIKTPYYEIDLSSSLATDFNIPTSDSLIKQIPYTHYKFDYNFVAPESVDSSLNVEIDDTTINGNNQNIPSSSNINTSVGSPIFHLEKNPEGYVDRGEQEEKTKDFLYGYSREGKSRYPIVRLDGFKYGVECGSKKSILTHFKNNSYGQSADKIMGTTNYATARLDRRGNTVFERVVEKRFVNEYFEFISVDNYETSVRDEEHVYNKDRYCRSYYPYIEDANNSLSQLNNENAYFDESFVF